jgi:hypothetical protein
MRRSFRRRVAAAFCTVALLFNVVCGVVLSAGPSQADIAARALENGWTIICSANGALVIDADGNRVPDDPVGHPGATGPHCLFCLPLMHGNVSIATAATIAAISPQVLRHSLPPADVTIARIASIQAWPRAPPSSLIG